MASTGSGAWSQFLAIAKPFYQSDLRWRGYGMLTLLVVLLFGVAGLNVVNSFVGRDFMTAIESRESDRVPELAFLYLGVFIASTVVAVFERYIEQHLGLIWRKWLTEYLTDRYLAGRVYYRINRNGDVDNPDQRISEDVRTFTQTTLSFLLIILNSTITLLAFAGILWAITPWLLAAAVGYAAFGTVTTALLGRRLVLLDFLQLKKEADLRYELIRVREHAEPIALQHAEAVPRRRIRVALARVVENFVDVITVNRNLGFFRNGYNYLTQLIPLVIVAPLYIRSEVQFGVVTQGAMAFSMVMGAFSVFVVQFQDISSFAAVIRRLGSLWAAVEEPPTSGKQVVEVIEGPPQVVFERLTLLAADGRSLVKNLTLEVPPGKRLLVTGQNSAGRAAMFRAVAGLWRDGRGRILRPPTDEVMFLPHHPYLMPGPLRDQLSYSFTEKSVTDGQILEALHAVGFDPILERVGGLSAERDWSRELSAPEQQLLAFARLLLIKPLYAFLDEALSVFESSQRRELCQALAKSPITYVSAGSDPMLMEFHDTVLELYLNGSWQIQPLRRYATA